MPLLTVSISLVAPRDEPQRGRPVVALNAPAPRKSVPLTTAGTSASPPVGPPPMRRLHTTVPAGRLNAKRLGVLKEPRRSTLYARLPTTTWGVSQQSGAQFA